MTVCVCARAHVRLHTTTLRNTEKKTRKTEALRHFPVQSISTPPLGPLEVGSCIIRGGGARRVHRSIRGLRPRDTGTSRPLSSWDKQKRLRTPPDGRWGPDRPRRRASAPSSRSPRTDFGRGDFRRTQPPKAGQSIDPPRLRRAATTITFSGTSSNRLEFCSTHVFDLHSAKITKT